MNSSRISDILKKGQPGQTLEVAGWVRTRRDSKQGFSFVELNDGSCLANLQIVIGSDVPGYESHIKEMTTGASLHVAGELKESPGKGQRVELAARDVRGSRHGRREGISAAEKGAQFRVLTRNRPPAAADEHVRSDRPRPQRGLCVDPSFFPVPRLPLHPDAHHHDERLRRGRRDVPGHDPGPGEARPAGGTREVDFGLDFFGKRASLTVSGQLEAEIFATSLGNCYTFGPTFRAENSNTTSAPGRVLDDRTGDAVLRAD